MSEDQPACRMVLDGATPGDTTHAGLWFDKFFAALEERQPGKAEERKWELAEVMAALPASQLYAAWYMRWEAALSNETLLAQAEDYYVIQQPFSVQGRMVIGLGADAPLENSITLHRTYGVPYIPGSALKGLVASYAYNRLAASDWRADPDPAKADRKNNISEIYKTLFGTTDEAGFITFFDALYIPGTAESDRPLRLDVLTVHHQDYYQGAAPPADWDSPIPVPFLSAVGSYLVALAGPRLWVTVVQNLLRLALADVGIGAKTSSGYGRMQVTALSRPFERRPFVQPKRRQQLAALQDRPPQTRAGVASRQPSTTAVPATGHSQPRVFGTIVSLPPGKAFGFIKLDGQTEDVFFHLSTFQSGSAQRGQRVSCIVETQTDGRRRARDVRAE